jgi:hypothetical protein
LSRLRDPFGNVVGLPLVDVVGLAYRELRLDCAETKQPLNG